MFIQKSRSIEGLPPLRDALHLHVVRSTINAAMAPQSAVCAPLCPKILGATLGDARFTTQLTLFNKNNAVRAPRNIAPWVRAPPPHALRRSCPQPDTAALGWTKSDPKKIAVHGH
jgi:hypothetical protein